MRYQIYLQSKNNLLYLQALDHNSYKKGIERYEIKSRASKEKRENGLFLHLAQLSAS